MLCLFSMWDISNTYLNSPSLWDKVRPLQGWVGGPCVPAVHYDGVFGPVGLLADNVDELQDALDGVDRGHAVVGPGRVVEVQHVLRLVSLQGATHTHTHTHTPQSFQGMSAVYRAGQIKTDVSIAFGLVVPDFIIISSTMYCVF